MTDQATEKTETTENTDVAGQVKDKKVLTAEEELEEKKKKDLEILVGAWGDQGKSKFFDGAFKKIDKTTDGFNIHLKNGQTVEWHKDEKRGEFIGMSVKTKDFTIEHARSIVATCAQHGWKSIAVSGDKKCRDLMWLEAQRQGLTVKNHTPGGSIKQLWEKEKAAANLPSVQQGEEKPQDVKKENETPASTFIKPDASKNDGLKSTFISATNATETQVKVKSFANKKYQERGQEGREKKAKILFKNVPVR